LVPVDIAASALIKQTFVETELILRYYSVENPFPTSWELVLSSLSKHSPQPLRIVPTLEWFDMVRQINANQRKLTVVKLLPLFMGRNSTPKIASLGWNNSVKVAPELASAYPTAGLMDKYILYQLNTGNIYIHIYIVKIY